MHIEQVIIKPLLTEKTQKATESYNRYAFEVKLKANKHQIKNAIESLFNVKVLNVKTSILPGSLKRFGRKVSKSSKTKRAYVKVGEGQKIELFKI